MSKIDFYLIPDTEPKAYLLFTCRLIEKIYTLGHKIYIHTTDNASAQMLHESLWTFRDISFVPHQISDQPTDADCPVVIGCKASDRVYDDVLINLASTVPDFYQDYQRVIEIVPEDDTIKQQGRAKYACYKKSGDTLETHDLRK